MSLSVFFPSHTQIYPQACPAIFGSKLSYARSYPHYPQFYSVSACGLFDTFPIFFTKISVFFFGLLLVFFGFHGTIKDIKGIVFHVDRIFSFFRFFVKGNQISAFSFDSCGRRKSVFLFFHRKITVKELIVCVLSSQGETSISPPASRMP